MREHGPERLKAVEQVEHGTCGGERGTRGGDCRAELRAEGWDPPKVGEEGVEVQV